MRNGVEIESLNIFGTLRREEKDTDKFTKRLISNCEKVVSNAKPGDTYTLKHWVGGGGGHCLNINKLEVRVTL